jgi:S-adenosylmethionine hydrolase
VTTGDPGNPSSPAVFFLSDYGTVDEFAGVVHAVLHRLAPGVPVIDLSHRIPHFDVGAGSAMLVRCAPHLGAGVVLAVVDPGVGNGRRGLAVETGGSPGAGPRWLVGPDNGLLADAAVELGGAIRAVSLNANPSTFDGRDVFAPAAAHLVMGGDPAILGTDIEPGSLELVSAHHLGAGPVVADGPEGPELVATVRWVDSFGNVQLDLGPDRLDEFGIRAGDTALVIVSTHPDHRVPARRIGAFTQLGKGELGLLVDANGWIALVVDRASAADRLAVTAAEPRGGPEVRIARSAPSGPQLERPAES